MAVADYTLKNTSELVKIVSDGFKYNLQVLPDVITSASFLFSVLFQSAPMAVFATALLLMSYLHGHIANFVSEVFPGVKSSSDYRCSGQFPGITYSYLLGLSGNSKFGTPASDKVPSYYTMLMGFIMGWIGTLPTIYEKELNASPQKKAATTGGLITLGLLAILVLMYRMGSGCEGFLATSVGLLLGFVLGLLLVFGISQITDRRATNMLGLPLIRDKAADGKPIYVCERPAAKEEQ